MPLYHYRAVNRDGRKIGGQLNANNEVELYQRLRENGLELLSAREQKQRAGLSFLAAAIKNRDLVQVCMHLEQMSRAGVSLIDSLGDVRDSVEQRRLKDILVEVCRDVAEGKSLSEAVARHPRVFGTVFQSLLAAGETSGDLSESFGQLVKHLKWTEEVRSRIKKAVRYPSVMVTVMLSLFIFMMIFVVPQVVSFLLQTGQTLPLVTRSLIATSDFVQNYWWAIILAPIAGVALAKSAARLSEEVAFRFDYLLLRLPVLGTLIRKIALSRFSHFFATMFQSGVPILDCLQTAQSVVANRCLARSLQQVRSDVQSGTALSASLRETGEFPTLVIRMIRIGEESGRLGATLENVSEFYDHDVSETIDMMVAMIEPVLTLFAGGMMVWIAAGVLFPIYNSFGKFG